MDEVRQWRVYGRDGTWTGLAINLDDALRRAKAGVSGLAERDDGQPSPWPNPPPVENTVNDATLQEAAVWLRANNRPWCTGGMEEVAYWLEKLGKFYRSNGRMPDDWIELVTWRAWRGTLEDGD